MGRVRNADTGKPVRWFNEDGTFVLSLSSWELVLAIRSGGDLYKPAAGVPGITTFVVVV